MEGAGGIDEVIGEADAIAVFGGQDFVVAVGVKGEVGGIGGEGGREPFRCRDARGRSGQEDE